MKEGILLIDKPQGITSYYVVDYLKRKLNIKKIGHAGTLDPMATGLLIILIKKYTKFFNKFANYDKEYQAILTLGITTDTGDSQGRIIQKRQIENLTAQDIIHTFSIFVGQIQQIPPMVSALRFKGKRLYDLARKGILIPRKPRWIHIHKLEIKNIDLPNINFYVKCSKGTYVRSLANDIGQKIGCGGHISKIRRIRIGPFSVDNAISFNKLKDVQILDESYLWPQPFKES